MNYHQQIANIVRLGDTGQNPGVRIQDSELWNASAFLTESRWLALPYWDKDQIQQNYFNHTGYQSMG